MTLSNWFKNQKKHPAGDPAVHPYLDHFRARIPKDLSIREFPFVVLDTETTGLNPAKDEIISIACYRIQSMSLDLSDRFDTVIRKKDYPPGEHTRIHGIMAKHMAAGSPEREALLAFLEFIGGDILVGHHIAFDTRFLNKALKKHFNLKLKNKSLDTAAMASRLEKPILENATPESLDALCARYGISPVQRHTAAGDAYMTAILFMKLLSRLEKRGVATYRDLLR